MKQAYSLLVVDDEAISREHVLRDIRWEKLDVKELYEASGGLAALDLIRRHHPDIMILDLRMPEVDGLKVLETMREEKLEVCLLYTSALGNYLMTGVLESYLSTKRYFGGCVVPLYIEVEDGERLARALLRERGQENPKYAEMCRRFLSDEADFAEERLREAGVGKRYQNRELAGCLAELRQEILSGK